MKKLLSVFLSILLLASVPSFAAEATLPGYLRWGSVAKGAATAYGISKLPSSVIGLGAAGVLGWDFAKEHEKRRGKILSDAEIRTKLLEIAEAAAKEVEQNQKEN